MDIPLVIGLLSTVYLADATAVLYYSDYESGPLCGEYAVPNAVANYSLIDVRPFAPSLGAEVRGLHIADGISSEQFTEIHNAFLRHQVLFFKDQREIEPAQHIKFARMFGDLHSHPAAPTMKGYPEIFEIHAHKDSVVANGEFWHSDVSCDETPPLGTILQLHILPSAGGDTMFSDMYGAFEALPPAVREELEGLTAVHESSHVYLDRYADRGQDNSRIDCPSAIHPVVRTHPETGRKALYVNRTFTTKINGIAEAESRAMLGFLFDHAEKAEHQIRFRWSLNDIAFWDNRCCMHHAIWDYWPEERKGRRVTVIGDKPR